MDFLHLLDNTVSGALAAAGFGVLFNIDFRALPLRAASGALALGVRTVVLVGGWSIEAASLVAALVVGFALLLLPARMADLRDTLHVVGCIPMVPGGFATKAVLGLFAIRLQSSSTSNETTILAIDNVLRVIFTIGALGTGLAIPTLLVRGRGMK